MSSHFLNRSTGVPARLTSRSAGVLARFTADAGETPALRDTLGPLSRRACLGWAAASLASLAVPTALRAACPCGGDDKDDKSSKGGSPSTRPTVLRVCADPNNLPFSNRKHEGFEDKIAELVAKELGLALEYEWLPQRLGFYRIALKNSDSNLVMAAPAGFERALTTNPYYRSTFVFVTRKGGPAVTSLDDPALQKLKVGVPLTGGANSPPTHALAKRKIIDNVSGFSAFDETEGRPGEKLIKAVATSEIDVAIAWGPHAGFYAQQLAKTKSAALQLTPVTPEEDTLGEAKLPFTYDICMGLRRSDQTLRDCINGVIVKKHDTISEILQSYGVPLLPVRPLPVEKDDDDHGKPQRKS